MLNPATNRLIKIGQDHIKQWRSAIKAMKAGKFSTHAARNGRIVDTTQETIHQYSVYISDMEEAIKRMRLRDAQRPQR